MPLGVGEHPQGLVGSIRFNDQPSGQNMCANCGFSVVFDWWIARVGRWRCQMIFGSSDVAGIMQLPDDGERLRMVARRHDASPSIVSRLWIS